MSRFSLRTLLSGLSELCLTLGVLIALYLIYLLGWTSVVAHRSAAADVCRLTRQWRQAPAEAAVAPVPGRPFATLRIPSIRNPVTWPVLDGVAQPQLIQGIGWYPGSALPGHPGNFAVAAHRRTWGDMFRYLNEVKTGDVIEVQEGSMTYAYRVIEDPVYVPPTAVDVLDAVPHHSGLTQPGTYITLTTCDPVYNAYRRLIVFGELTAVHNDKGSIQTLC
jgi:sortase A